MNVKIELDRELFEEVYVMLSISYLMHEDPSEKFTNLMKKLDEINNLAGTDIDVVVPCGTP